MTGTIFTGAYFNGIALTNAATEKPATIASGAYVGNTAPSPSYNGDAVYGDAGTAWTVVNDGTIVSGSGASLSIGIDLKSGGAVTNGRSGSSARLISGQSDGVAIESAAGTVANFATITASTGFGVYLGDGGRVTNGHSGSTAGLISGDGSGVLVEGAAGTVANFATIAGSKYFGVILTVGGSVTNGHSGSSNGLISGTTDGVKIVGAAGTVANFGAITSSTGSGVYLYAGGSVTNGHSGSSAGLISGDLDGVLIEASAGTVANFATIAGSTKYGVYLTAGGSVTNGESGSSAGLISGQFDGVKIEGTGGSVANFATIAGSIGTGVYLHAGGSVTNGHRGSSFGLIYGNSQGVVIVNAAGTVTNFGTITAPTGFGVLLDAGGSVTNGHSGTSAGLISGHLDGVEIEGSAGTVANSATIAGSKYYGVVLEGGGSVTNGHSSSSTGLISGYNAGVYIKGAAGTVANFATISGAFTGVVLAGGGSVTNGHSGSSAGMISGNTFGVFIKGTAGTVANFGTIAGPGGTGAGVALTAGGSVTNGQSGSIDASISGGPEGVYVSNFAAGTVADFGIISGTLIGVELEAGGRVTVNRYAAISGNIGISIAGGAGTVISGGVISGSGGTALQFGASDDTLILDPTAAFYGKVDGGGGSNTLELRAGATSGTLTGIVNFGHVTVDFGANWTVGIASPTAGQIFAASGGSNRLVLQTPGTIDLSGVSGFPTIVLANSGAANSTNLNNANFTGLTSNVITVIGGDFGNTVDASALTGSNRVILVGGIRADHFTGGAGNDIFKFSAANLSSSDRIKGGGGSNELLMTSAGTIRAGGVSGVETIQLANGGANHLTLTSANFAGVAGHVITVDDGNSGNTIVASTLPSADAIIVHAGTGTDTLKGGAGNDIFIAGGKTTMTGRAGKNQFTFADVGANTITDFSASASNELVLRNSGFNLGVDQGLGTGTPKHLAASAFVANSTGAFTNTSQRFAYNTTTGALSYSADGSGSADSKVVTLTGHPALSAGASGQIFFTS